MTRSIRPQTWMTDANSITVMQALSSEGATARFVGGCVRDAVLGRQINDVDIATDALPNEVTRLLEAANIKVIPTGLKHGTVTAVVNHIPFEITTLRHDVETFGRHANVKFSASWEEDAARRDFTMNAMSLDLDGRLHDYFGGFEDARAGCIRFVGNPTKRLEEDYLRLLRYFRFHAHYSEDQVDEASLAACTLAAPHMAKLSGERIRQEVLRLFRAPDPTVTLKIMIDGDLFKHLFTKPALELGDLDLEALNRYLALESRHGLDIDSFCRMAVFMKGHLDEKQARKLANRIVLSNQDKADWLCYILQYIDASQPKATVQNYHLIDRIGGINFKKLLATSAALDGYEIDEVWWGFIDHIASRSFPLQGRDALQIGLAQGPEMGKLLKETRLWWLESGFVADKAECLEHLSALAKTRGMV